MNIWNVELTTDEISVLAISTRTTIQREFKQFIYDLEHRELDETDICITLRGLNIAVNAYNQIDTTPEYLKPMCPVFGTQELEDKFYSLIEEYKEINENHGFDPFVHKTQQSLKLIQ